MAGCTCRQWATDAQGQISFWGSKTLSSPWGALSILPSMWESWINNLWFCSWQSQDCTYLKFCFLLFFSPLNPYLNLGKGGITLFEGTSLSWRNRWYLSLPTPHSYVQQVVKWFWTKKRCVWRGDSSGLRQAIFLFFLRRVPMFKIGALGSSIWFSDCSAWEY